MCKITCCLVSKIYLIVLRIKSLCICRYKVPSRKTVMRRLQNKKTEVDVKLKKEISLSENISITHDGWTSLNTESYFTTTVHFINESWELKNAVLGTIKVTGSHTSEAIADELKATQTKWGLPTPLATTDNAANEKKAYEILGWDRFGCYGHRINLMVKNSLNIPEVNRLLGKARKLVTFFHQSSSISDLLCEKQKLLFDDSRANLVGHKLIIDVATRWNSSLYMLQRLSEQFPVLMALANDPSLSKQASTTLKNCVFSFEEQSIIENIVAILEPFEKATTIVCADQVPTVHKILPIITKLLKIVEVSDDDRSVIKKIKDKLQCEINRRTLTDKITLLGCVLNPFTKDLNFAPEMRDQARAYLIEESGDFRQVPTLKIKTEKQDDELSGQEVSEASQVGEIHALPTLTMDPATDRETDSKNEVASDEGPPTKKMKSVDTDDWLEDIVCTGESEANPSTAIELEIDRYLGSKIIEKDLNLTLLQWWKMYEHFYPRINRIAKKYLCLPASSVSSERVFSLCGQIVNKKRCRLSPKNIDTLVFLNKNIAYW